MQRKSPPVSAPPVISCLMITQQGRLNDVRHAIGCFIYQQISPIELVIVHDSSSTFHHELLALGGRFPTANINVYQEPQGHTLGWLRNRSLEHAKADLVCQWDDDDFNHPARLKIQYDLMHKEGTDFCFMTDQLHLYTEQKYLFWDDCSPYQAPLDLIENTMLGKRMLMGRYPDLARGEDTAILEHLFIKQHKISRLRGMAWLYTYVFNGKNTWDFKHHSERSLHQRLNATRLLSNQALLEKELNRYDFPFESIYMPHEQGKIEFKFQVKRPEAYN